MVKSYVLMPVLLTRSSFLTLVFRLPEQAEPFKETDASPTHYSHKSPVVVLLPEVVPLVEEHFKQPLPQAISISERMCTSVGSIGIAYGAGSVRRVVPAESVYVSEVRGAIEVGGG